MTLSDILGSALTLTILSQIFDRSYIFQIHITQKL